MNTVTQSAPRVTFVTALLAVLLTAPAAAQHPLGGDWFRADAPSETILEMMTAGGYGNGTWKKWVLYGDGTLEETVHHPARRESEIVAKQLTLAPGASDRLLQALIESGVPGSTPESLLAATKVVHPRVERFYESPDCPTTRIKLRLLRREPASGQLSLLETDLSLECIGHLPQSYPGVTPLKALADVHAAFVTASVEARSR